ncbi:iron-containing redox enzyme family protein [Mesorhizobium sp. B1-1-7]|uniref:iron-containing redox enzyme family protein n=1 Tax=Mesorhizobium sp. B1-1-7 TaxID=2589977 RepID=UPI0011287BE2|nr:iron-containing redox enzyme family protein [Mesorhizobium sp. B1-1-7]TPN48562.1 iron-containing redox enzyme family protein [Mesorhizobium sp. B1-1-7]
MNDLPPSVEFRRRIDLAFPAMKDAYGRLLSRPDYAEVFPEYGRALYFTICASVPLMESALRKVHEADASDKLTHYLAPYLERHIREERHHDEWLLEDLAKIGYDRDAIYASGPPFRVAQMVGAQYYWIHHYHPLALFGYIGAIEGYPPTEEGIQLLNTRHNIPTEALRTALLHAKLDPIHKDDLDVFLNNLSIPPHLMNLMCISGISTISQMCGIYEDLAESNTRTLMDRAPRSVSGA